MLLPDAYNTFQPHYDTISIPASNQYPYCHFPKMKLTAPNRDEMKVVIYI